MTVSEAFDVGFVRADQVLLDGCRGHCASSVIVSWIFLSPAGHLTGDMASLFPAKWMVTVEVRVACFLIPIQSQCVSHVPRNGSFLDPTIVPAFDITASHSLDGVIVFPLSLPHR